MKMYKIFIFQWVGSLDLKQNNNANANVIVKCDAPLLEQVKINYFTIHNIYMSCNI